MGTSTPAPLNLYKPDDSELVDVDTHLGDNYDKINDWAAALDDRVTGKLWRTSGFSGAIGTDFVDVVFDASRITNGMALGPDGDSLVVPTDGMYKYAYAGYATGSDNSDMGFVLIRIRAAVADLEVGYLGFEKRSGRDYTGVMTDEIPLKAGDRIKMQARSGNGAVNYYGINEATGVRMFIERVGDLNGATPV